MRGAIVTIGNFDGVHRGHVYMLRQVADRAGQMAIPSYAVTFEPHPQAVLHPERQPSQLLEPDEKRQLLLGLGMDQVWVCPFTRELSLLGPREFMNLVQTRQRIEELWIGSDFALGRDRTGTVGVLAEIGAAEGWALHVVPPYRQNGQVVSSTGIRGLLATGDVRKAADLLGRWYALGGQAEWLATVPGTSARMGTFTASPRRAPVATGLYAGWLLAPGSAPRPVAVRRCSEAEPVLLIALVEPPPAGLPAWSELRLADRIADSGYGHPGEGSDRGELPETRVLKAGSASAWFSADDVALTSAALGTLDPAAPRPGSIDG